MHKALILLALIGICGTAQARELKYETGKADTYSKPFYKPDGQCDVGLEVVLDTAERSGDLMLLKNFVKGMCEIYVVPNERVYAVSKVEQAGCGSKRYLGARHTRDGLYELEVIDHRTRMCRDLTKGLLIVTEKGPQGSVTTYSSGSIQ